MPARKVLEERHVGGVGIEPVFHGATRLCWWVEPRGLGIGRRRGDTQRRFWQSGRLRVGDRSRRSIGCGIDRDDSRRFGKGSWCRDRNQFRDFWLWFRLRRGCGFAKDVRRQGRFGLFGLRCRDIERRGLERRWQ